MVIDIFKDKNLHPSQISFHTLPFTHIRHGKKLSLYVFQACTFIWELEVVGNENVDYKVVQKSAQLYFLRAKRKVLKWQRDVSHGLLIL